MMKIKAGDIVRYTEAEHRQRYPTLNGHYGIVQIIVAAYRGVANVGVEWDDLSGLEPAIQGHLLNFYLPLGRSTGWYVQSRDVTVV